MLGYLPPLEIAKKIDWRLDCDVLSVTLSKRNKDKIIELLEDYIGLIMFQSKQKLSFAKGLIDEESIIDRNFKYEPNIIECISDALRLNQEAMSL